MSVLHTPSTARARTRHPPATASTLMNPIARIGHSRAATSRTWSTHRSCSLPPRATTASTLATRVSALGNAPAMSASLLQGRGSSHAKSICFDEIACALVPVGKMVHKLNEMGKDATTFYYENMEGGHGGVCTWMGTCSMHLDLDMMGCARFLPRVDASLSGSGVSIHVAAQLDRSLSASHPRRRLTTSSARSCRLLRLSFSSRNSPALQTSRAVLKVQRVRARQPTWNLCWITLEHTGQQIETTMRTRFRAAVGVNSAAFTRQGYPQDGGRYIH